MSKLEIKTRHSRYLIDTTEQTAQRLPFYEDANDLSDYGFGSLDSPGQVKPFVNVFHAALDEPLVLQYADGTWSRSTLIESIIELDEACGMKQYENNVDGIRVGDTVKVEGVVSVIGSHGVVFGDGLSADYDEVQVVKRRRIKVGDGISGADVQSHQWKRGTVIKWVGWSLREGAEPVFWMLNADATWSDTSTPLDPVCFEDFGSDDDVLYEVVYLP